MHQAPAFCDTPRKALEIRRQLLQWWSKPGDEVQGLLAPIETPEGVDRPHFLATTTLQQQASLRYGGLFLVSDEMTEVARSAAQTLPDFAIEAEDLPTPAGLLIFHHSPCSQWVAGGLDPVAVTWNLGRTRSGKRGVVFTWYVDRATMRAPDGLSAEAARTLANKYLPPCTPVAVDWGRFGEVLTTAGGLPMAAHVLSSFLLMQQPIAARDRVRSLPIDGRRARRAGIVETDVTVIKLRHVKHAHETGVARPTEWRHRWIVSGHWRNQWLPSRGVHRPTWISPHIKGPENRPIKVTEKVHVWSR